MGSPRVDKGIEFTWKIENCDFMWNETFIPPSVSSENVFPRFNKYSCKKVRSPLISVGNPRHSVICVEIRAYISNKFEHLLNYELVCLDGSYRYFNCEVSLVEQNGETRKVPDDWYKSIGGVNVDKYFFLQETLTLRCRLTFPGHTQQYIAGVTELKEKINKLFSSGEFSDLTLYTEDKEFFVHKFLLRKRAPKLLEDLGPLDENCKTERVKVDHISTPVLQTLLQYIYSGNLDVLPEENLPELYEIVEKYQIEEYCNVIHLKKSATITTQLKVIRKIICYQTDFNDESNDKTIFLEHVNFECARFLIKVSMKTADKIPQIRTRIRCLCSLNEDIFMSCITSSGIDINDLEHGKKIILRFSAGNSKQEKNLNQYLKNSSKDIKSVFHLQFNLAISKGRYFSSVDGMNPVHPGHLSIFGMKLLRHDMADLFPKALNCEDSGDVTLCLKDDKISAHKAVLAAWSPVFSSMFHHEMKEKNSGAVNIPDIDYNTGLKLLRFMYSGKAFAVGYEGDAKLYAAADKYQVSSLFSRCSSFLASHLTSDNACETLVLADQHSDENLIEAVQKYIASNSHDILGSSEWLSLIDSHPRLVSKTLQCITSDQLLLKRSK